MNAIMAVAITARQLGPVVTAKSWGRNSKASRPLRLFKLPTEEFGLAHRATLQVAGDEAGHVGKRL